MGQCRIHRQKQKSLHSMQPFTLEASPAGEIISGSWDNVEDGHPDFAWVPYSNSVNPGRSENPYLEWTDLLHYLTEANNGTSPVRE